MPFAVIIIAAIFIVTGFRGSTGTFLHQLESDVSQLIIPFVAIVIVGAIGYIPGFKKLSDMFLALILIAMFLANGKNGLFSKFQSALKQAAQQGQTQGNVSLGTAQWSDAGSQVGNMLGAGLGSNTDGLRLQPLPLLTDAGSLAAG